VMKNAHKHPSIGGIRNRDRVSQGRKDHAVNGICHRSR